MLEVFAFLVALLVLRQALVEVLSRVQRNSVPSTQMRCMITANRRARATIAFFFPRRFLMRASNFTVPCPP
jgi:hypothetical protein